VFARVGSKVALSTLESEACNCIRRLQLSLVCVHLCAFVWMCACVRACLCVCVFVHVRCNNLTHSLYAMLVHVQSVQCVLCVCVCMCKYVWLSTHLSGALVCGACVCMRCVCVVCVCAWLCVWFVSVCVRVCEICDVSTGLPCRKPLGSKVVMSTLDCDTSCHTSQHVSPRDWIFSVAGALPQPFVGGCCCHGEWPLHWNVAFTGWLVWHCQGCPSGDVQVSVSWNTTDDLDLHVVTPRNWTA